MREAIYDHFIVENVAPKGAKKLVVRNEKGDVVTRF